MGTVTRNNPAGSFHRPLANLSYSNQARTQISAFSNDKSRRLDSVVCAPIPPTTSKPFSARISCFSAIPPPSAYQTNPSCRCPCAPKPPTAWNQNPYPPPIPTAFSQKDAQLSFASNFSPGLNNHFPQPPPTACPPLQIPATSYWLPQPSPQEPNNCFPANNIEQQKYAEDPLQNILSQFSNGFCSPPVLGADNSAPAPPVCSENSPCLPVPGFLNSNYPQYVSPTSFNNCSFHYSGIPDPHKNPLWTSDRRLHKNYKINRSAGDDQPAPVPRTTKDALRNGRMKFGNSQSIICRKLLKYECTKRDRRTPDCCGNGKGDAKERMSRKDRYLVSRRKKMVNKTTNVLNIQCQVQVPTNSSLQTSKADKPTKETQLRTNESGHRLIETASKSVGTNREDTETLSGDQVDLLKWIAQDMIQRRGKVTNFQPGIEDRCEHGESKDVKRSSLSKRKMKSILKLHNKQDNKNFTEDKPPLENSEALKNVEDDRLANKISTTDIAKNAPEEENVEEIFLFDKNNSHSSMFVGSENDHLITRTLSTSYVRTSQIRGRRAGSLPAVRTVTRRLKSRRRARSQFDRSSKMRSHIANLLLTCDTNVDSKKEFCIMPVICIRNCSPCRPCCSPCCSPCRPCTPTRITVWQTFPYQCTPSCCTTGCGSGCAPCCPPPCCPPPCCPPPCCPPPCCPPLCCPCPKPCCPPPLPQRNCCTCPPPPPCPPPNRPVCCSPPPCPPRCCPAPKCRSCSPCGSMQEQCCSPCGSCCRTVRSCSPCSLCPPEYKPCKPCRPLPCPPGWRPCQPCCNPCNPPTPPCCPPRPCCPKPKCCIPCNPCCRPRCPSPCRDPCCPPCPAPCCPPPCRPRPCRPKCCPKPCCDPCYDPCCDPCCPPPCPPPSCPRPCCPKPRCCRPRCCSRSCSPCRPCCSPPPCCPPPCCQPECCPPCCSPRRRCCPRPCPPPCSMVCCPRPGSPCSPCQPCQRELCSRSCSPGVPCCPPPRPPPSIPRRSACCRPPSNDVGQCCRCPPCQPTCPPCPCAVPVRRCCRRRRRKRCCCCCPTEAPLPQTPIIRYCPCPRDCICPTSCPCPVMPAQGCPCTCG